MIHYLSKTIGELPEYMFCDIDVPIGLGIYPCEVYTAESLVNNYGNKEIFDPMSITDVTTQDIILVLNGGFEQTKDGRRPIGNADYTTYKYQGGSIATTLRLQENQRIEISIDGLIPGDMPMVGGYLVPTNNQNLLSYVVDLGANPPKRYILIEKINYFRRGGQSGEETVASVIGRVINYQNPALVKYYIAFHKTPSTMNIVVKDANGNIQTPDINGNYALIPGNYTYDASAAGYITATGVAFAVATNITIEVELNAAPAITDLELNLEAGLQQGNANVETGAMIGTLAVTGGTAPYVYSFNEDAENGANNNLFVLDSENIKVGENALTEGSYKISLKVIDSYGVEKISNGVVTVAAA